LGTAALSVGGSAGVPSTVSSLNRDPAIRSSYPPGAGRRRCWHRRPRKQHKEAARRR
jgi:hypothetical protein